MSESDYIQTLSAVIEEANATQEALQILGGNSKSFYGNKISANTLDVSKHIGIVDYEPSELYITARNGTLLSEIEEILEANNQMLPFEPPHFSPSATLGGTVACALSGPRRAYASSMRDCVLGVNIVNGKGEYLEFGGQVMKNVAGYDASRLMCGAFGTLGVLTQISLRVSPKPHSEITIAIEINQREALENMNAWTQTQLPISATYFNNEVLYIRIAGLESTTKKAHQEIGGQIIENSEKFWNDLKNHQTDFFRTEKPLWRIIIPNTTPGLPINGESCLEWNGGLRWIKSNENTQQIINLCKKMKAQATLFKTNSKTKDCLASINPNIQKLHLNLKTAFDPKRILNPGRMYSWC
ncbi:MAG: glycolate oxidase subunit GlcE [Gammaproteobacteria bacterium]|nr:glycolate oxidase subunit GlcE [Gammaproteobacteria bacterium]